MILRTLTIISNGLLFNISFRFKNIFYKFCIIIIYSHKYFNFKSSQALTSIVYFLVSTNKASSYCHLAVISDIIFGFLQRFVDSHEQEYKTSGR